MEKKNRDIRVLDKLSRTQSAIFNINMAMDILEREMKVKDNPALSDHFKSIREKDLHKMAYAFYMEAIEVEDFVTTTFLNWKPSFEELCELAELTQEKEEICVEIKVPSGQR